MNLTASLLTALFAIAISGCSVDSHRSLRVAGGNPPAGVPTGSQGSGPNSPSAGNTQEIDNLSQENRSSSQLGEAQLKELLLVNEQYMVIVNSDPSSSSLGLRAESQPALQLTSGKDPKPAVLDPNTKAYAAKMGVLQAAFGLNGGAGGSESVLIRDYDQLPIMAVKSKNAEALRQQANVVAVVPIRLALPLGQAQLERIGFSFRSYPELLQLKTGSTLGGAQPPIERNQPIIGIIDSGIDHSKGGSVFGACGNSSTPDQSSNCRVKYTGYFPRRQPTTDAPDDSSNLHGTAVAATAAEITPSDVGFASLRVFENVQGIYSASTENIVAASNWALCSKTAWLEGTTNPRCKPLNFVALNYSLGFDVDFYAKPCDTEDGTLYTSLFSSLTQAGIVPVVAAGNAGGRVSEGLMLPACSREAFSVGALSTAASSQLAVFSNAADFLNIVAPGQNVDLMGFKKAFSGTSFAAPYVAGAVALVALMYPEKNATQIKDQLTKAARKLTIKLPSKTIDVPQLALDLALSTNSVSASSGSPSSPPILCGGTRAENCYDKGQAVAAGVARTPSGKVLTWTDNKLWVEKGGRRILRADGTDAWSLILTPNGRNYTENALLYTPGVLAGRRCPFHTMTPTTVKDEVDLLTTDTCLYYDQGSPAQLLNKAGESQLVEGEIGLTRTTGPETGPRYRPSDYSWYEGNVQTCAAKGMRLPTLYETTASAPSGGSEDMLPLDAFPTFSPGKGVPAIASERFFTASSARYTDGYEFDFWIWSNLITEVSDSGSFRVRCVVP